MRFFWYVRLRIYSLVASVTGLAGYFGKPIFIKGLRRINFGYDSRIFPGARLEVLGSGSIIFGNDFRCGHNLFMSCTDHDIRIGDATVFSANIFIGTQRNDFSQNYTLNDPSWFKIHTTEAPVYIGSNCFIGYGAAILPGTTLEDGCVVGANSVVSGHFVKNSIISSKHSVKFKER